MSDFTFVGAEKGRLQVTPNFKWVRKKIGKLAYDRRFVYYDGKGEGSKVYARRVTRAWWKPVEWLGNKIIKMNYFIVREMLKRPCNSDLNRVHSFVRRYMLYTLG